MDCIGPQDESEVLICKSEAHRMAGADICSVHFERTALPYHDRGR